MVWEKIFMNHIFYKGLMWKVHKKAHKIEQQIKKQKNPNFKKWIQSDNIASHMLGWYYQKHKS
jgi:hypothetical protein